MRVLTSCFILSIFFAFLLAFPTTPEAPKLRRRKTTTLPPPTPKMSNRTRMGPEANFKDFFNRVDEFTKQKEREDLEKSYVARGFGAIVEI